MKERNTIFSLSRAGTLRGAAFFSPERVRRAVADGMFSPWFQPVVCADTGRLCGCEVLLRWESALTREASYEAMITWLEHSELIVPVTTQLMQQVADILTPVSEFLPAGFRVGMNICAGNLLSPALEQSCEAFLACPEIRHVNLVLELTERIPVPDSPDVTAMIFRLAGRNITFALDDFGTGWATYQYVKKFPVRVIKIDRVFVRDFLFNDASDSIIDSIICLADKMKLDVVAEGVEIREQADGLCAKGVKFLQGYLFSPPLSGDEFISEWLVSTGKNALCHEQKGVT
ncbi:TPA: EAL domain-containing protein [Escherichia coli]|nr:EAL domain-containing protein [Escherichia coli]